jgi:hypothetical protein
MFSHHYAKKKDNKTTKIRKKKVRVVTHFPIFPLYNQRPSLNIALVLVMVYMFDPIIKNPTMRCMLIHSHSIPREKGKIERERERERKEQQD